MARGSQLIMSPMGYLDAHKCIFSHIRGSYLVCMSVQLSLCNMDG